MRIIPLLFATTILAGYGLAQDRINLGNGDVITGKIKTMANGKVTIESPVLGVVTVALADIENLTTEAQVRLETVDGEMFKRRIAGIEEASFSLEGDLPPIPIASLNRINPPAENAPKWTGSVLLSGLWIDGNTRRRAASIIGEAVRKTDIDRITVDASWEYAEDNPQAVSNGGVPQASWNLTQRRAGAGLKYDYFVSDRWYTLATMRVLGDTFADIDLRFTAGVGAGYTVIDDDTTSLTVEAGLSYFNESYRSNTPSQDYMAARVAYKFTRQINEQTKLTHGVEAYPSLENTDDIYLQMKTELSTKLAGNLIAALTHILDYDNTPAPGFRRDDHRVLLSIGWNF